MAGLPPLGPIPAEFQDEIKDHQSFCKVLKCTARNLRARDGAQHFVIWDSDTSTKHYIVTHTSPIENANDDHANVNALINALTARITALEARNAPAS